MLRWEVRQNIKNWCWWWGFYDLLFSVEVQSFYDCMTWMNIDWLSYQENWCLWIFCEKKKELFRGYRN